MDLERVRGVVSMMIQNYEGTLDIMRERPDWLNVHDFRSGKWIGTREKHESATRDLKYIMWWLDQVKDDKQ